MFETKKIVVSAIISTYNSALFFENKLTDLLNQTIVNNLEIIVVNSGSNENEDEVIKPFLRENKNIKYILTKERETIYTAWNRGIAVATGEFITNANTDDRLRNDAYEIMARVLAKNYHYGIVYSDQILTNKKNEPFRELSGFNIVRRPSFSKMRLFENFPCGSQMMWRAEIHSKFDIFFNEEYEIAGDYDFVCRVAEHYNISHIPQVLGTYFRDDNYSNKEFKNFELTQKETQKVRHEFVEKYLSQLSHFQIIKLYLKTIIKIHIPSSVYWHFIMNFNNFFPEIKLINQQFYYWFYAMLLIRMGKVKNALIFCQKKLKLREIYIVKNLYGRLIRNET